ncbi:UNVERIFIED_CONTAM: hypothetical protein GTU68_002648 [Idotea baltica]|nr:hypothetical protein [Idotea baltica]
MSMLRVPSVELCRKQYGVRCDAVQVESQNMAAYSIRAAPPEDWSRELGADV